MKIDASNIMQHNIIVWGGAKLFLRKHKEN